MSEDFEEWRYFVHGTTTALSRSGGTISQAHGRGDFGAGFYVFEDTGWGRQSACAWARRKALGDGGTPMLIRVRLARSVFATLERYEVPDDALDAIYNRYSDGGESAWQVMVGPVGKNALDGRRVPNRRLPRQYKFAGRGIAALIVDAMLPCEEADR